MRFEWDTCKSEINLKRHRVSFEEAVAAFFDSDAVDDSDPEHSTIAVIINAKWNKYLQMTADWYKITYMMSKSKIYCEPA